MERLSLCGIGMVLASVIVCAQPNGGGPGPVLGIVEIPDTFFLDPNTGQYVSRSALRLYVRPDLDGKVFAEINLPASIDEADYDYEAPGALVYGRERGHFLIRTSRGLGWLAPYDAGSFHPLETLITSRLTYLTDAWDGFVSASPGGAARTRVPQRRPSESEDVRVKRFQTVEGKLWVEIEVISHSFCESEAPATIKSHGWIRAHDRIGAPTIWFYSRGC